MTISDDRGYLPVPAAIDWAGRLLVLLAILQVVVAGLLVANRAEVVATFGRANPGLSPGDAEQATRSTVLGSVAVHLIVALLYGWLAFVLRGGRNWTRILATILLLLGALGGIAFLQASSAVIPNERSSIALEQFVSLALRAMVIWLLWYPVPSRLFFSEATPRFRDHD